MRSIRAVVLLGIVLIAAASFSRTKQQASRAQSSADVEKRVDALLAQLTLEEKIDLIGGMPDFYIRPIARLKIPQLKDVGWSSRSSRYGPTIAYPSGISVAASWDVGLAHKIGVALGQDARARGVHFVLAPAMNIYRAPMNGRNFEYFGEDPYLASRLAVSEIEGIQSQRVIATAKHFVANSMEYGRLDHSSDVDERTLREIYLPAFEASVREGNVGAVMDAYNLVNGVHMTQNGYLNNEILKKEWGFSGILMSDWGATYDGIAAANGGLDLEMPSGNFMNRQNLIPAIQQGKVPVATIDDKVRRILRKEIEFGFLDGSQTDPSIPLYNERGREVALEAARDGMVLLKNDSNLLPLAKTKIKSIAVIGPNAYPAVIGGGGSSLVQPFNSVSYLEGISDYLGPSVSVLYAADSPRLDELAGETEFQTTPDGGDGLAGEYFDNQELEGAPAVNRTDWRVSFSWGDGSYAPGHPVDHFSARWSGYYVPKSSGEFTFYISSDDGARLYLDDELIVNDWHRHAETLNKASRPLEAGRRYKIRLEYFEQVGGAAIHFGIASAGESLGRETKALAARADAVILCVGFDASTETEGSDRTFRLPEGQDTLISEFAKLNKNVVVVLTAGGNVEMTRWIKSVPALIDAWYPGQEGGKRSRKYCSETRVLRENCQHRTNAAGKIIRHSRAITPSLEKNGSLIPRDCSWVIDITISLRSSRCFRLASVFRTRHFSTVICACVRSRVRRQIPFG